MGTRAQMIGLVGRVGYHVTRERLLRPRPSSLDEVPAGPEALTADWLSRALCAEVPGAQVVDFELGPRNDGTSARRTLRVTYNDAGRAAGLPEAVFSKSAPGFLNRMVGAGAGLARIELTFYRDVRPLLDIEAPRTLHAAFDPVSHRQMLLTDDVAVTRGASFGTALDRTLTREQAEQLVRTLAAVNARFWGEPLRDRFGGWLRGVQEYLAMLDGTLNARARIASGFERARDVIEPEVYRRRGEAYDVLVRSQHLNATTEPQVFVHGDVHPGNWYLTGDGRLGLYDWQMCVIGGPARDLAYALSTHLPTEDRRAWERELLEAYLDELRTRGVADPPTPDELFLAYRRQVIYGFFAWLATIGRSPLQPRYQPDEISKANLRRISQACADLETFDTVKPR